MRAELKDILKRLASLGIKIAAKANLQATKTKRYFKFTHLINKV